MQLIGQKKWQAVIIPLAGYHFMLVLRHYLQTIAKFKYQASVAVGGDHIQSDCPNVWVKLGKCFIPFSQLKEEATNHTGLVMGYPVVYLPVNSDAVVLPDALLMPKVTLMRAKLRANWAAIEN